jgi:hypothetical protein
LDFVEQRLQEEPGFLHRGVEGGHGRHVLRGCMAGDTAAGKMLKGQILAAPASLAGPGNDFWL